MDVVAFQNTGEEIGWTGHVTDRRSMIGRALKTGGSRGAHYLPLLSRPLAVPEAGGSGIRGRGAGCQCGLPEGALLREGVAVVDESWAVAAAVVAVAVGRLTEAVMRIDALHNLAAAS
ncbi:hypothetical protein QJS10_CPA06g00698 [Acorus calamus]|uniref:Uncharacterized protein n=1 Tax=Acorus calamus TaxID=4465 RepID=A0AAV9EPM5_ACOCL|nr:hypothetical protein QJS10_CPA06g00698 [Acorus calamus]